MDQTSISPGCTYAEPVYGLSAAPFAPHPDPRFFFESRSHKKAMAHLEFGLAQGEGAVLITGAPGTGKTTLKHRLKARVSDGPLSLIEIAGDADAPAVLLRIAEHLAPGGAERHDPDPMARAESLLAEQARQGRRTLLIADDAHGLAPDAIGTLHHLAGVHAEERAPLQLVMFARPELADILARDPALKPLLDRVIARYELQPLGPEEAQDYLHHRLRAVDWAGRPELAEGIARLLHERSGGIPRELNLLAAKLLDHAANESLDRIEVEHIAAALGALAAETGAFEGRIAALEKKVADQEATIHRLLALIVDWLEEERGLKPVKPRWGDRSDIARR